MPVRPALLLLLTALPAAGCAIHAGPPAAVELDCRYVHRTFDGGWQPDGARGATVYGRDIPMGQAEFTPRGRDLAPGTAGYANIEQACGNRQMAAR